MTDSSPSARGAALAKAALLFAWAGALLFVIALTWFLYAYLVRFGRPATDDAVVVPALVDIGLFTAFATHHSLFARTPLKAWLSRHVHPALERSTYTWMASALFLLTCTVWQPVHGVLYVLQPPFSWLGLGTQCAGVLLTFLGSRAIDVLDLAGVRPVLRARRGAGKPGHVPLVTGGVFRIVRHPLYFGWALLVFGTPTMTATRAVFAVVSTAYLAVAIPWEEKSLLSVFGSNYREYQQRVRWRMIPFIY